MYLSFSLHLSSYLSLRSDINCLLPNLIRNFRRRDNLTSFLFSLTRSEPLLYGGLVPRIFLSIERVCERTSERPCSSLPIQFISLRSTHVVRSCLSPSPISRLADTDGTKKSTPNWPTESDGEKRAIVRRFPLSQDPESRKDVNDACTRRYRKKNRFSLERRSDEILFM